MEARAREARCCEESNGRVYHVPLHHSDGYVVDSVGGVWRMVCRPFQGHRSGNKSIYSHGVQQMMTNLACVVILTLNAFFAFGIGAYNHVARDMAFEAKFYKNLSMAALSQVEVKL